MDDNVKRLVETIKQEASKDELFSMERVKESKLYKALAEEYDNIDEVCEMALKKSSLYEMTRDALLTERKKYLKENSKIIIRDNDDRQADFLVFIFGCRHKDKDAKFKFRYSSDEMKRLALEAVKKYPVKNDTKSKSR